MSHMKVLIVDDSVCNSINAALMLAGHSVDAVIDPTRLPPLNALDLEVLICGCGFERFDLGNRLEPSRFRQYSQSISGYRK